MEYTKSLRRAFSLRSKSSKYDVDLGNDVKRRSQSKGKMKALVLQKLPSPTSTSPFSRWPRPSPRKEANEKSVYDVPWDGPFIQAFVVLPKSRKTRLARLATFKPALCHSLTMFIKNREAPEVTMDSGGLTDFVTMSGLDIPDYSGWMYDLDPDSGQRSWCVLADMLLCVFANTGEETPRKVMMLPGQEVKVMVFNSAKHDALPLNGEQPGMSPELGGKTITGMLKYQMILTDPCSGEKHVFGLNKQEDVDTWVSLIRVAVSLDTDIFTESDEDVDGQGMDQESDHIHIDGSTDSIAIPGTRERLSSLDNEEKENIASKPKMRRFRSFSIPTELDTCTTREPTQKYVPSSIENMGKETQGKQKQDDQGGGGQRKGNDGGSLEALEIKSNSPVFSRVKRAESLSTISCMSEDSLDPGKTEFTLRPLARSKRPSASSIVSAPNSPLMNLIRRVRSRAASSSSAETSSQEHMDFNRERSNSVSSLSSTSTDASDKKSSGSIGSKIVRKASTFKIKVFGSKGKSLGGDPVYLGSLTNVKISGYLGVRHLLKWADFWCLVSQGHLHCFNTQSPSDTPELSLLLRECSIHFLNDTRSRKHTFKLCPVNAKSVHLAAKDNIELSRWIIALRREIKAWDDAQTHARPPPGVIMNRHSLGSQLSLESSTSLVSHVSLASENSGISHNSSGSGTSSLSSLSQNSGEKSKSITKPKSLPESSENQKKVLVRQDTFQLNRNLRRSSKKQSTPQGPVKVTYPLREQNRSEKPSRKMPLKSMDSPSWQTPCPAHGLETSQLYQWNEHFQRSSSLKGSQSSTESFGCPTTPDSEGPDSVFGPTESHHLTNSLRNVTVNLTAKYSSSPKYEHNLHQVWKNDKNYQLQMLKAKVSALPNKPAIFNRHLPGPYNEGLLLVSDSTSEAAYTSSDSGAASQIGDQSDKEESTITRNPSVKLGRKFSLKRRRSLKDYSPGSYIQRRNSLRKVMDAAKAHPPLPSIQLPNKKMESKEERKGKGEEEKLKSASGTNEDAGLSVNFDSNTRRRSLSDGQLPVTLQQFKEGFDQASGAVKDRSKVEVTIPARELNTPTLAGYLEQKEGDEWTSCWCVLKDNTLYTYAAPIDDVTQDVLQLPGYQIQPCLPSQDKYIFQLVHPDYSPITLSAENSTETETWMESLHLATQKLTLDSLNLDMTNSMQYNNREVTREELEEEARKQWQKELLKLKKQQLLREVLQQKEELTKKQSRLAKIKQSSFEEPVSPSQEEKEASDQMMRERAILRQRKVSAQLKLEMVQQELHTSLTRTKTKKRGFKLPGLKSDKSNITATSLPGLSPDIDSLEIQIKELSSELNSINWELEKMDQKSATLGSAAHRRKNFAVNSFGSSESGGSRDRSRSDLSMTKVGRGYPSEPNLLNLDQNEQQFETITPDALSTERIMDVNSKVQLMSYSKIGSNADIPMIDDSPSPTRSNRFKDSSSNYHRESVDSDNMPVFNLDSPVSSPVVEEPGSRNFQLGSDRGVNAVGLNKSCDLIEIQGYGVKGKPGQRMVPRSKSESNNLKKSTQISASALAEIAAFEELVQKKMKVTTSPLTESPLAYR